MSKEVARMSSEPAPPVRPRGPSSSSLPLDQRPTRIRVLVVDDHTLIRQGVRRIAEDCVRLEVVGEASNGLEAIEAVRLLGPDVVVMDIY